MGRFFYDDLGLPTRHITALRASQSMAKVPMLTLHGSVMMLGMSLGSVGHVRAVRPAVQPRFGIERDLFNQPPEYEIENDPLLIQALKLAGIRPNVDEKTVIKIDETGQQLTGQQLEEKKRNTFDIVRNRHRW